MRAVRHLPTFVHLVRAPRRGLVVDGAAAGEALVLSLALDGAADGEALAASPVPPLRELVVPLVLPRDVLDISPPRGLVSSPFLVAWERLVPYLDLLLYR